MRQLSIFVAISVSASALASDHNNLDKERPLRFEDAYSIAYRSFEFQNGVSLEKSTYHFRTELQYGFAKNKDLSLSFEPSYATGSGKILGNFVELSYFEGVSREIGNSPALGYRLDLGIPVSGREGVEIRARGILTKTAKQYDKLHLNLDVTHSISPPIAERQTTLGAILGYSNPIGYPTHFDQIFLAEWGIEQSRFVGEGFTSWVGVGLRRQLSATGVLDFGLQTDLSKSPIRVTVGYSVNF